jgi:integrase/recombinase XerD
MQPVTTGPKRRERPDELAAADEPDVPDVHDTPLAAVVPSRAASEIVPKWEARLPGFLKSLYLACAPGTCRTYLEALTRFIEEVDDPLEADAGAIEDFLARELTGRQGREPGPRSASSRTVELAALRRYYRWALRERLLPDDPTSGVTVRRGEPYRDIHALGADEARALLAAIPDTNAGARLRCLCLWYLLSGRRRVEIAQLRWGDLDFEAGTYHYTRKGGRTEKRPLLPVVRDATLAYATRCKVPRSPHRPVFPGRWGDVPLAPRHVTRLIEGAARAAGITTPRPVHALRHSYARLLREVGATVEDVQHSLDHASLATTSTYLRKLEGSDDPFGPRLAELLGVASIGSSS